MRLHFDYNEVSSEDIKAVVDFFYKRYRSDDVQFGAVNVYISARSKEDNASIGWCGENGKERELYIKSRPLKTTNKKLIATLVDDAEGDVSGEKPATTYIYLK